MPKCKRNSAKPTVILTICNQCFRTKKHLSGHVEAMRDSNDVDQLFMKELLTFHETYDMKLRGRQVHKFKVNAVGNGFEIVFTDGSVECVSFRKLIKNAWQTRGASEEERERIYAKNRLQTLVLAFKQAARYEIYDQVRRFRAHKASANLRFADGNAWHVGHDYETALRFDELLENFFKSQPKDLKVHLEPVVEGGYTSRWVERDVAEAWQAYHQKNAVLRMETWRDNLCGNRGFAPKLNWAKDRVAGYRQNASVCY